MSGNKSNHHVTVVCARCSYDANPVGTRRCHKCGNDLVPSVVPTSNKVGRFDLIPYVFLGLLALIFLIFGGFGYYYGQQYRFLTDNSNRTISSDRPPGKAEGRRQRAEGECDGLYYNEMFSALPCPKRVQAPKFIYEKQRKYVFRDA